MSREPQKICLFGGTFDPIHCGHLHIAEAAIRELNLSQLVFLPCRKSPHKTDVQSASSGDRLKMCQLATDGMDKVTVDDFDLTAPEPSYSWRTVEHFRGSFPDAQLFWLMGTDQWQALPRWNRAEHLASMVEFIVFTRDEPPAPRDDYRMHSIHGHHPASATKIRQAAAANDQNLLQKWLEPQVLRYIKSHHLYISDNQADG